MNDEVCERWSVVTGIDWPAADVCFTYEAPFVTIARMRFSNVVGGSTQDLTVRFPGVIALRHESESFGLIPLPDSLPRFGAGRWSGYTYPLLKVRNSRWLAEHHARNPVEAADRHHFVLVSMNDLLHILALSHAEASWSAPVA
jgi:hypothetical protein